MVATNGARGRLNGPPVADSEIRAKVEGVAKRVLVVDDNDVVRGVLERLLQMHGFDVISVSSGEEAVAMYQVLAHVVDAVMLDMCMPGMDGYDTFRVLRAMRSDSKVILCSGGSDAERVQKALREGALALVTKPYDQVEVLRVLDRAVGASQGAQGSTRRY